VVSCLGPCTWPPSSERRQTPTDCMYGLCSKDRRRVVHFNVTTNPTARWTAQQIVEAFPYDSLSRLVFSKIARCPDKNPRYCGSISRQVSRWHTNDQPSAPPRRNRLSYQRVKASRTVRIDLFPADDLRGCNKISRVGNDFADECNVPQSWRTLQWQSRCSWMSSGNESSRSSRSNRCTQASGDLGFPTGHVLRGFSLS